MHELDHSSLVFRHPVGFKIASRMTIQYILSVIESAITSIDSVENTDDISSSVLRLECLNRVIVGEGLPDPIVSSLGQVLLVLGERDTGLVTLRYIYGRV